MDQQFSVLLKEMSGMLSILESLRKNALLHYSFCVCNKCCLKEGEVFAIRLPSFLHYLIIKCNLIFFEVTSVQKHNVLKLIPQSKLLHSMSVERSMKHPKWANDEYDYNPYNLVKMNKASCVHIFDH